MRLSFLTRTVGTVSLFHNLRLSSRTMSFYAFLLLTLSCIPRPSTALFKDQAGKWDWRQSYIGRAKFIESDATQSGIKRVFVATHDNALAAVNARSESF